MTQVSVRPIADQRTQFSVVLPAHNEAQNIAPMVRCLSDILSRLGTWEIVFVNDCSTDRTLDEIKAMAAAEPRVRYVSFLRNFGHQPALRAGLQHARGDAVIVMDCDFEHPPEHIPELVAKWHAGAKVVVTHRETAPGQLSLFKQQTSRLFYRIFDAIGDVKVEPGSADFMLLDRVVVDTIAQFKNQDVFLRGLVRWLGFPIAQVSYQQGTRQSGESKFTTLRMVEFAIMGIVAHSIRPLRLAIHLSLIFAVIAVLLLAYSIVSFLWIGHTVAGWTSEMSAIALLGAGQFLVLGIIGEYVGRLMRESRGWPIYLVAETEEDNSRKSAAPETAHPAEPPYNFRNGRNAAE